METKGKQKGKTMSKNFELACELADKIYFDVLDILDIHDKCTEPDIENKGGTRNTELGKELYWSIEGTLQDKLNKPQANERKK